MAETMKQMTTGRRVKVLRTRRGWSQRELADRAGVSQKTVSEVENDLRDTVIPRTLYRFAKALDVDVLELM